MKVTSDIVKATIPDCKRVLRAVGADGTFLMDVLCREGEMPIPGETVFDPTNPSRHKPIPADSRLEEIRRIVMAGGESLRPSPTHPEMADHSARQLRQLPEGSLRLINPHRYKVSITRGLQKLRTTMIEGLEPE
jgi:nicotinate phosphoribosyltransferase